MNEALTYLNEARDEYLRDPENAFVRGKYFGAICALRRAGLISIEVSLNHLKSIPQFASVFNLERSSKSHDGNRV